jgi:hypothetical protein
MDDVNYFLNMKAQFINCTMTGRSRARTQILPPQDELDNQIIHTEKWTLYGLGNAMTDSDNIF